MTTAERLAREFSRLVKDWLSPANNKGLDVFHHMLQRHVEEHYATKDVCITHEYLDPNAAMIEAFTEVFGHDPEGMIDVHNKIINDAWSLAKQNNFYA